MRWIFAEANRRLKMCCRGVAVQKQMILSVCVWVYQSGRGLCLKSLIAIFIVRILLAMSSYITSNVINISHNTHKYRNMLAQFRFMYVGFLLKCLNDAEPKTDISIAMQLLGLTSYRMFVYFWLVLILFQLKSSFSEGRSLYIYISITLR